jgi:hypothetical protein
MQVEEGVAMILISECMGYDPGTLHVKMTSFVSTISLDEEGRYWRTELLGLWYNYCFESHISSIMVQVVVVAVR